MPAEPLGAQDGLRRYNLSRVLGEVHRNGPISRSDLAARTNLNRSTVATLVGELHARGLVEEIKPRADEPRPPGRPSPLVQAHRNGVTVLACDIAVDTLRCAIIGIGGRVYAVDHIKRSRNRVSPHETMEDLTELADVVCARVPDSRLVAVGVGIVGAASQPDGIVQTAPNLGWYEVPLAELVAASLTFDVPVRVGNEANLGAIAEHARGAGAGVDHFLYLSSEIGLGAGIIVDGEPLVGADGYAGEAGHVPVNPLGQVCGCGARGCWETEVGERALLRAADLPVDGGVESLAALFRKAEAGNPQMLHALTEIGQWLGLGLVGLINLFNPRRIVLGGVFARGFPFLANAAEDTIARRCRMPARDLVQLVPARLGDHAVLLGAAELALGDVLSDPAIVDEPDGEVAEASLPPPIAVAGAAPQPVSPTRPTTPDP